MWDNKIVAVWKSLSVSKLIPITELGAKVNMELIVEHIPRVYRQNLSAGQNAKQI